MQPILSSSPPIHLLQKRLTTNSLAERHRRLHPPVHTPVPDLLRPLGLFTGSDQPDAFTLLPQNHTQVPQRGVPHRAAAEPPPYPDGALRQRPQQGRLRQEPVTGAGRPEDGVFARE